MLYHLVQSSVLGTFSRLDNAPGILYHCLSLHHAHQALENTSHNAFPVVLRRESQRTAFMDQEDENVTKGQANAFGGMLCTSKSRIHS